MLYRITKDHGRTYTAGFETNGGMVTRAAPRLNWLLGRKIDEVRTYCDLNQLELLVESADGSWLQVLPVIEMTRVEYNKIYEGKRGTSN